MNYYLAQANIGRIKAPLESPIMKGFVDKLKAINALADADPGFVWRLQDDAGDATAYRPFPDDMLLINLSVWNNIDALFRFTYYSDHAAVFRDRKQWFETMTEAYLVLWWVPEGHIPTLEEVKERLDTLRERGPTPYAFTFKQRFAPPSTLSHS
jgi:hypothetical protein